MKANKLYLIGVVALVLTISITLFLILEDVTKQPVNNPITGYSALSGIFLAVKAFGIWQKILQVIWTIISILAIVFILCGIGICLHI